MTLRRTSGCSTTACSPRPSATPDKQALVVDGQRAARTRSSSTRRSRFARALQELGLERGDRVVVFMDNSLPCVVSIFGTLLAGGVFVVVNPQTKEDKLAYILDDCEASFLVTEGTIARVAASARSRARRAFKAVVCAGGPGRLEGMRRLRRSCSPASPTPASPGTIPLDLAALIYTSGTTGHPKGVMMTHQNMVFAAGEHLRSTCASTPTDRILGLLPLAFDYGLYQLLMSVRLGATLVLERSFVYPGADGPQRSRRRA